MAAVLTDDRMNPYELAVVVIVNDGGMYERAPTSNGSDVISTHARAAIPPTDHVCSSLVREHLRELTQIRWD